MTSANIEVTVDNGLRIIKLNRPEKYNAITLQMYVELGSALRAAAEDERTRVTVITGSGDYYCSGNDLNNFQVDFSKGTLESYIKDAAHKLQECIQSFIDFPKLLVAVVNGPAIGIAVTTLALCDVAYCKNTATFSTPFIALGQVPEACSSLTFPKIMGTSLANEVLLLGRELSAAEALSCGLVSRVSDNLDMDIWPLLRTLAAQLNVIAAGHGKALLRGWDREALTRANVAEISRMEERWGSQDCMQAVLNFFNTKSQK